jgi:hypothetical protein
MNLSLVVAIFLLAVKVFASVNTNSSAIYSDAAELVRAHKEKRAPNAYATLAPGVSDGVRGVKFIEAAVASSGNNGAWTALD